MEKIIRQAFIPEPELIQNLKSKSREAFEYLYDHYSAALFGVILKIVVNEQLAEEILHDAYMRIWNKIGDYDSSKGRLFTWMINISRNLAIDRLRSADYTRSSKTYDSSNLVNIEDQSRGHRVVDGIGMDAVLLKLPEEQRLLIDMMYYKGFSQSEISEELNMPVGTVKTRVRAGMLKLRELLK